MRDDLHRSDRHGSDLHGSDLHGSDRHGAKRAVLKQSGVQQAGVRQVGVRQVGSEQVGSEHIGSEHVGSEHANRSINVQGAEDGELLARVETDTATTRAHMILAKRALSEHEVRLALREEQFDDEIISEVISTLTKNLILDDAYLCERVVHRRVSRDKKSRSVVSRELLSRGIDPALIEAALAETSDEDEQQHALELAYKRRRTSRTKPNQQPHQSDMELARYLSTKGFAQNIIRFAVEHSQQQRY